MNRRCGVMDDGQNRLKERRLTDEAGGGGVTAICKWESAEPIEN